MLVLLAASTPLYCCPYACIAASPTAALRLHCQAFEVLCEHLQADIICHDDFTAELVLRCVVGGTGVQLRQQVASLDTRNTAHSTTPPHTDEDVPFAPSTRAAEHCNICKHSTKPQKQHSYLRLSNDSWCVQPNIHTSAEPASPQTLLLHCDSAPTTLFTNSAHGDYAEQCRTWLPFWSQSTILGTGKRRRAICLASSCGAASSCLNASCSGCSGKTHMALSFTALMAPQDDTSPATAPRSQHTSHTMTSATHAADTLTLTDVVGRLHTASYPFICLTMLLSLLCNPHAHVHITANRAVHNAMIGMIPQQLR